MFIRNLTYRCGVKYADIKGSKQNDWEVSIMPLFRNEEKERKAEIQEVLRQKSAATRTVVKYFSPVEASVLAMLVLNNHINALELQAINTKKEISGPATKKLEAARLAKQNIMEALKEVSPHDLPDEFTVIGPNGSNLSDTEDESIAI
jgi:hypothetical protein